MRLRTEGATDTDAGTQLRHSRASLARPTSIDQIEVEVKVEHVEVTGCASNPAPSVIRAVALTLNRFSDGPTPPPPGSLVGDYLARIQLVRASDSRDTTGVRRVEARLFHCLDAGCVAVTTVAAVDFPDAIALGRKVRLQCSGTPLTTGSWPGWMTERCNRCPTRPPAMHARPSSRSPMFGRRESPRIAPPVRPSPTG